MEDFDGKFNFVEYEKRFTADGYYIEYLNGTEVYILFDKVSGDETEV